MSAPKSDTATIEARKNRLLELLTEGKSQVDAAEILRREGYPADDRTIRRDVTSLRGQWGTANMNQYEVLREQQLQELVELRDVLSDPKIKPDRKVELTLAIIDREARIAGTNAASKSMHLSVSAETDPAKLVGYRKFLHHTRHLSEEDVNRLVFPYCDSLPPSHEPNPLLGEVVTDEKL